MAPKVILTRPLDPTLLEGGALLDRAEQDGKIQLVRWTQDKPVDRQWLLDELRKGGTEGLVCMHNGEKVRSPTTTRATSRISSLFEPQYALRLFWSSWLTCPTIADRQ